MAITASTPVPPSSTPAPGPQGGAPVPDSDPPPSSPAPPSPAAATSGTGTGNRIAAATVTAYYVLVDDGGRHGVRFGCNDSLVGLVQESKAGTEPLAAAVGALLDAPEKTVLSTGGAAAYNALSGSRLKFLSGSFDGTTVTVYLTGVLRPGGTCDVPRMEAQLTQTALAAVGAIRAQIYVNGHALSEAMTLG